MPINSYIYGLRKKAWFTKKELKNLFVTVLIIGFIVGFNDKRGTASIDGYYIFFMLFSVMIASIAIFIKLYTQRMLLYRFGQKPEYKYSINTLLIGVVLAFASEGLIWLAAPGYTLTKIMETERLGKFRYGLNYFQHGFSLAFGSWMLLITAAFLSLFVTPYSVLLIHTINIFLAISLFSLLPLPENDGIYIFFSRRWLYFLNVGFTVFVAILLKLTYKPFYSLLGGITLGFIFLYFYSKNFEK